jgi:DNA-binding GntR family transcriptional regulator
MSSPEAASQRVAAYLRDAILSGEIAPGEWIRQAEVAERLGASRLPVREALRILQSEGLADYEPNRGSRVPKLGMHEVAVLYQMRERLEPLALIESIPNLTTEQLGQLAAIQDRIEGISDVSEFVLLDREFHLLTYAGCAISHLQASVVRMWNSTQHYRRAFVTITGPSRQWVITAEHRLLLDAITRQDAADAERYLSGHIRRTRIELTRHPEVFR